MSFAISDSTISPLGVLTRAKNFTWKLEKFYLTLRARERHRDAGNRNCAKETLSCESGNRATPLVTSTGPKLISTVLLAVSQASSSQALCFCPSFRAGQTHGFGKYIAPSSAGFAGYGGERRAKKEEKVEEEEEEEEEEEHLDRANPNGLELHVAPPERLLPGSLSKFAHLCLGGAEARSGKSLQLDSEKGSGEGHNFSREAMTSQPSWPPSQDTLKDSSANLMILQRPSSQSAALSSRRGRSRSRSDSVPEELTCTELEVPLVSDRHLLGLAG
ncbi:hypothetical protein HZH66_011075 [Vespula vulgaris]|uniref:Uncharacterized protein n=1 Tax=Vespula vulgaris TaxID=7454 RepID=A0A834JDG4_VESVU|nr:hypothetical protein HZH66_011075 [Vespula vulgaris]